MTTVDSFREHATEALEALDAKLPKGSHVVTISLVDGRVLWNGELSQQSYSSDYSLYLPPISLSLSLSLSLSRSHTHTPPSPKKKTV